MICNLTVELQDSAAHRQGGGLTLQSVLGRILEVTGSFSMMVVNSILSDPVGFHKFHLQSSTSGPHVCAPYIKLVM